MARTADGHHDQNGQSRFPGLSLHISHYIQSQRSRRFTNGNSPRQSQINNLIQSGTKLSSLAFIRFIFRYLRSFTLLYKPRQIPHQLLLQIKRQTKRANEIIRFANFNFLKYREKYNEKIFININARSHIFINGDLCQRRADR